MQSLTVDCDTFSNEGKVAVVVPVTSLGVAGSEEMPSLASFPTML